jgi:hypothetical protein
MSLFSPRLPHILPPRKLARLLVPTYAAAAGVDEDEALERLGQALENRGLADDLYRGLSSALADRQGPRTPTDRLLDRLSAGVEARAGRVRAASTSGLPAVVVRVNLELGLAPEGMRATLSSARGAAALEEGLRALGAHIVKELLR